MFVKDRRRSFKSEKLETVCPKSRIVCETKHMIIICSRWCEEIITIDLKIINVCKKIIVDQFLVENYVKNSTPEISKIEF